jgi:uncharacterized protein (TIGR00299 family) protein
MKVAYFDTIAGISGDMCLGALLSAGVDPETLRTHLNRLAVGGFEIDISHVERNGIAATKVDVIVSDTQQKHRHLGDITRIIRQSDLSQEVRERSIRVFTELAAAEARVHRTTPERVHFHEVGAVDAVVDIVGTCLGLEQLGVHRVFSSPVKVGRQGFVQAEHGRLPVPSPATVELLRGYPLVLTDIDAELTTPTGAALIRGLSEGVLSTERLVTDTIGYGSGSRDLSPTPNLLRLIIGELAGDQISDEIVAIETNIDDMIPEALPHAMGQLLEAGALDVFVVPVAMKKGRTGSLLSVLVDPARKDDVIAAMFRETTTIGVRMHTVQRRKLPRIERTLSTSFGEVRVKVIVRDGTEFLQPEFEECRRLAQASKIPLLEVYQRLQRELNRTS